MYIPCECSLTDRKLWHVLQYKGYHAISKPLSQLRGGHRLRNGLEQQTELVHLQLRQKSRLQDKPEHLIHKVL